MALAHPKNYKRCLFCSKWTGDAGLVFKNPQVGYEYKTGVYGKCMQNNSSQPCTGGVGCRDYSPSYEASRL